MNPTELSEEYVAAAQRWADAFSAALPPKDARMSPAPLTVAHAGLRLLVAQAEHNAAVLGQQPFDEAAQQQHIGASIGALLDTLDALEWGLGTRLRQAMYVHSHTVANMRAVGPL